MNKKLILVVLLSFLLMQTLTINSVTPISETAILEGKRLGCWFQLTSLNQYTPQEFFNNFFLKTPYFASAELIVQAKRLSQTGYGDWIKSLGTLANSYPAIELVVYIFWDMANEAQWTMFTDYLDEIQGTSSIKYVGIDGEHATYGGDFPDGKIAEQWRAGTLTDSDLISLWDRAKAEVEARGKTFLCYYMTYGPDSFKSRYPQVGHIRFPCQGGTEIWCDNQAESPFVGQSYGTYESHQFPGADPPDDPTEPVPSGQDNCALSQESYNRIIEHAVAKSDEVRHFIHFAVGFAYDSFTGVSGRTTNHIWDNPTWRSWIWQKVQTYPEGTFVLATTPAPPPTQYTLTIVSTTGGTTSPSPGSYDYDEDTEVSVLAIPDSGYIFNKWVYDGTESTENPITMEMTRDYTLTAYFVEQSPPPPTQYTLTIVSTTGGTTDPAPDSYEYDEGTIVEVLALPNSGYLFDKWIYDSTESIDNPIEVTIDQDYTLTAYFKEQPPPPPINGNLSIEAHGVRSDVTVTVTVNGHVDHRIGSGIVSFKEMAVGEYNCSVSASGYITETLSIEVIENTTQTYTVTLTPAPIVSELTLTNPSIGTQGCLAEKQPYTFQANISDLGQELDYIKLILDLMGENLTLSWTRSSDAFHEESDPNNYITLSGNSISNGTHWTLNFQITFSWNYPDENLHPVRLICMNASNIIKTEDFANVYYVENDLIIHSASADDNRVNPNQNITFEGHVYYEGTTTPPPGTEVKIKLGETVKATTTTDWSGYYSKEITTESAVGSYTYNITCEHSNEDKTIDVDVDKLEGLITADSYEVNEGRQVNFTLVIKRKLDNTDVTSFTVTIGRNGTSWLTISTNSFNDTRISKGHWTYSILSLIDNTYGVTDFDSNSPTVSWGRKTVEIWDGGTTNVRIDIGTEVTVWFKAKYSATGKSFGGDNGTLEVNGTEATWNEINNRWEYSTSESAVGKWIFSVTSVYDSVSGSSCIVSTQIIDPSVVWDRVEITLTVTDDRIDVGSTAIYTSTAFYEYDGAPFIGTVTLNDTLEKNIVGKYGYGVTSISGSKYGLTIFTSNTFYVIFDRIKVVNYTVSDADPEPYEFVWVNYTINYEYDGANLNNGIVYINGSLATFYTDHWALGVTFNELGSAVYHITEIRDNEHGLTAIKYEAADPEVEYVLKHLGDVNIVMPSEWETGKSGDITIWIKNTDNYNYKSIYVNITFESQNSSVNSVLNHRLPTVPSNNELTYQINILPPQDKGNYTVKIFIFYIGSRFELYDLEKQVNVKNLDQTPQPNGSAIAARIPEFTSIIIATSLGVCVYLLIKRRKKEQHR